MTFSMPIRFLVFVFFLLAAAVPTARAQDVSAEEKAYYEEKAKTVIDVDEGESDTGLEKEIGNMALKDANGGAEKSN